MVRAFRVGGPEGQGVLQRLRLTSSEGGFLGLTGAHSDARLTLPPRALGTAWPDATALFKLAHAASTLARLASCWGPAGRPPAAGSSSSSPAPVSSRSSAAAAAALPRLLPMLL